MSMLRARRLVFEQCPSYPRSIVALRGRGMDSIFGRIWVDKMQVIFNREIEGRRVKVPEFKDVESAKAWLEEQNQRDWRSRTEVPELEFENAGFGFWYASLDRYCIAQVGEEFQAWFRDGEKVEKFGMFPSIEGARGACNAHNRRAVLGE